MAVTIEFKMEREGLLEVGEEVDVEEARLLTLQGMMVYYTIIPALAMSNNIPQSKALKNFHGKVTSIVPYGSASFVSVEFEN